MLEERKLFCPKTFENLGITRREAEILFWITQGKTGGVIATLCNISLRTVQKHIENIYRKLGIETRNSAMLRALEFYNLPPILAEITSKITAARNQN
jgi:DNA-binding CsgD family transcriptional regulator